MAPGTVLRLSNGGTLIVSVRSAARDPCQASMHRAHRARAVGAHGQSVDHTAVGGVHHSLSDPGEDSSHRTSASLGDWLERAPAWAGASRCSMPRGPDCVEHSQPTRQFVSAAEQVPWLCTACPLSADQGSVCCQRGRLPRTCQVRLRGVRDVMGATKHAPHAVLACFCSVLAAKTRSVLLSTSHTIRAFDGSGPQASSNQALYRGVASSLQALDSGLTLFADRMYVQSVCGVGVGASRRWVTGVSRVVGAV